MISKQWGASHLAGCNLPALTCLNGPAIGSRAFDEKRHAAVYQHMAFQTTQCNGGTSCTQCTEMGPVMGRRRCRAADCPASATSAERSCCRSRGHLDISGYAAMGFGCSRCRYSWISGTIDGLALLVWIAAWVRAPLIPSSIFSGGAQASPGKPAAGRSTKHRLYQAQKRFPDKGNTRARPSHLSFSASSFPRAFRICYLISPSAPPAS